MSREEASPAHRIRIVSRFALFFLVWLVLTGARTEGIPFGLIAAFGATVLARFLAPPDEYPLRMLRLLALVPGFLWRSWAGGIDVTRRVFHPRLPLKTGWIAYPAALPAGAPRVLLSSELSLLPGTLLAGVRNDCLLVHCLDIDQPIDRQIAKEEARFAHVVDRG